MAHYHNPIHPPLPPSRSSYSSLSSASTNAPQASNFLMPNRRRVPAPIYTPTGKWKNATGRTNPVYASIPIDHKGYSRQGMRMTELCARGSYALGQMMHGAEDRVLVDTGLRSITLHILWPGVETLDWVRSIEINLSSGPISRAELAAIVAQNYARYWEKVQFHPSSAMNWYLGPGGIRFDQLVLVGIRNVFENAWQADIAIDL